MMALEINGNHVMCLDLRQNRVFDLHGKAMFGNNVGIEVCYTYIHPDDKEGFRNFIERLSNGTDKEAECRYRWDYNYTGKGKPDWHDMHGYAIAEYEDGKPVNIIATLTDESETKRKEREVEQLSERYKTIFENSIIGLSFYTPDGWLLDANRIMRKICNFDSDSSDEFFSKINLFEIHPFNEVLSREHPEDYWACSLSIIPERNMHVYLEISVHPIYDENDNLMYIGVSANDVTEERDMYERVKKNDIQMQELNVAIKNYEAELVYMMQFCHMQAWRQIEIIEDGGKVVQETRRWDDEKGYSYPMRSKEDAQDYRYFPDPDLVPLMISQEWIDNIRDNRPELRDEKKIRYKEEYGIPEYDKKGRLLGAFGVWRDISDLMHKQDQLRKETQRARESGEKKALFLANMTHEIRTPINAIVGFSEIMATLTTSEEKQEVVRIIKNNCDMLLRLMNDILTASSLGTSHLSIEPADVEFSTAFNELCESLRLRVQEPGVEFITDNPYDTLQINVDFGRVAQVITNFVTNAVKYTHKGHIKVGYHTEIRTVDGKERNGLYVYCEDTGEGISPEAQSRIFEQFYKVDDFVQGTGLGLFICKAFTDACNGDIGVISEGKGKGSVFWMWIPL